MKTGEPATSRSGVGGPGGSGGSAQVGLAMVVFALVGWSSVPLFVTHFSTAMNVWTQNGWRYLLGAMVWMPVLAWGWMKGTSPRGLWRASVMPAVFNALGQAAFTWSFYEVDTATAAFGLRTQIVFLAVGAYLLFPSERALLRRPGAWLGIVLVVGGVVGTMLLRDSSGDVAKAVHAEVPGLAPGPLLRQNPVLGMSAAVAAGLLFACYGLSVRKNMHGFHPVTAFAAISQITAGISLVLMVTLSRDGVGGAGGLDFGRAVFSLSAGQMGMLFFSALIGITLGHAAYFVSIARLGVATTSGVLQLQPFCVAILQYAVHGQLMSAGQWASGTVAVVGALVLLWAQWQLTRRGGPAGDGLGPIAGSESEGMEAAEMEAMPVESDGARR